MEEMRLIVRQPGDPAHRRHALRVLLDIPLIAIGGGLPISQLFGYDESRQRGLWTARAGAECVHTE
ncbi:hypothetical protein PQI23_03860 [Leucobacter sp. USCH14]|uniref:hypothetical protein n=1 Tax=Leucobacter sp. USCH14 TaxID=3024838 RepID=UPI0030AA730C